MGRINGLAMKLGDEDVQNGIKHRLWRAFKKIRETDKDASLAQADSAIDVGEAIKADLKFRQGRAGTQLAVCLLKNLREIGHLVRTRSAANLRNEREWPRKLFGFAAAAIKHGPIVSCPVRCLF